jgi:hypothetical protein
MKPSPEAVTEAIFYAALCMSGAVSSVLFVMNLYGLLTLE